MRIIKLSPNDSDMATRQAVDAFFRDGLPARDPAGKFRFPPGRLGQNGLRRGERLLFTYRGECVYQARAATGRVENEDEECWQFPFYFCVDLDSVVRAEGRLAELESELNLRGLLSKNLAQSQGWPSIPEDDRWAEVSSIIDRVLGTVPGDPLTPEALPPEALLHKALTNEPIRSIAAPAVAPPTGEREVVRIGQDRPMMPVAPIQGACSTAGTGGVPGIVEERLKTARGTEAGCLGFALFLLGLAMALCLISIGGSALCLYGGLALLIVGGVCLIPCFDLHREVRKLEKEASSGGSQAKQEGPVAEPQQAVAGFRTHHACHACGLVLEPGDASCRNCKQSFTAPVPGASPSSLPAPTVPAGKKGRGWVEVARLTGKGNKKSPPFEVGERWRVEWDTRPNDKYSKGFFGAEIYRVKGNEFINDVGGAEGADRDSSEEYGAGQYYLKINSLFQTWTVRVFNRE